MNKSKVAKQRPTFGYFLKISKRFRKSLSPKKTQSLVKLRFPKRFRTNWNFYVQVSIFFCVFFLQTIQFSNYIHNFNYILGKICRDLWKNRKFFNCHEDTGEQMVQDDQKRKGAILPIVYRRPKKIRRAIGRILVKLPSLKRIN